MTVHEVDEGIWFQLTDRLDDVPLPIDFYLREPLEVDRFDPAALAAFVASWGRFSDDDNRDLLLGHLREPVMEAAAQRYGWLREPTDIGRGRLRAARRQLGERLGLDPLDAITRLVNPVEVTARLGLLCQFAEHIDAWQSGRSVDDVWDSADGSPGWVLLRDHLNPALSVFQVRIDLMGEPESRAGQQVTGFSAAALQLWKDLESASYRHCDECGRLFTRQRGRSMTYSRSEGVRFHDRVCANRYTQREWRRRKRIEREGR